VLQQLAVGQQIITESPQGLHPGGASAQPYHTQGLSPVTIYPASLGQYPASVGQQDATGCNRQVHVQSSLAPLPGCVRFYSKSHHYGLDNVCHNRANSYLTCCCRGHASHRRTSHLPAPATPCLAPPPILLA